MRYRPGAKAARRHRAAAARRVNAARRGRTAERDAWVVALRATGASWSGVARATGVSSSQAARIVARDGGPANRPGKLPRCDVGPLLTAAGVEPWRPPSAALAALQRLARTARIREHRAAGVSVRETARRMGASVGTVARAGRG